MRQSGHKPGRFLVRPMPPDVHLGGGSLFNPMKNLFGLLSNRPYLVRESGSTTHHEVTVRANAESARIEFRDGSVVDLTSQSDVSVERDVIVFQK